MAGVGFVWSVGVCGALNAGGKRKTCSRRRMLVQMGKVKEGGGGGGVGPMREIGEMSAEDPVARLRQIVEGGEDASVEDAEGAEGQTKGDVGGRKPLSLPTLSTLVDKEPEMQEAASASRDPWDGQLRMQGMPGIPQSGEKTPVDPSDAEDKNFLIQFTDFVYSALYTEARKVEWPSAEVVLKVMLIVIAALIMTMSITFVVDRGLFWISAQLFETGYLEKPQ